MRAGEEGGKSREEESGRGVTGEGGREEGERGNRGWGREGGGYMYVRGEGPRT